MLRPFKRSPWIPRQSRDADATPQKNGRPQTAAPEPDQLEKRGECMHDSCMATKTISLELDAYEHLKAAKGPGESFSDVVRRATFRKVPLIARDFLSQLEKRGPMFSESDLKNLEKTHDDLSTPPDDPWKRNR